MLHVAGKSCGQTFLQHQSQSLMQGVVHVDGRCVVIGSVAAPVIAEQTDIEVPAGYASGAFVHRLEGSGAEGHGG